MKKVCVITDDVMLFQKIKLELYGVCGVVMASARDDESYTYLVDADNEKYASMPGIKMKRAGECDIPLPFGTGSLRARFMSRGEGVSVSEDGTVVVGNASAKLTEVELALFLALYNRRGGYATREELMREIWADNAEDGVLNVYIHYLRCKLERGGERVIISSRGKGYKINDVYFGGKNA